jgi:hypothetical protein
VALVRRCDNCCMVRDAAFVTMLRVWKCLSERVAVDRGYESRSDEERAVVREAAR